MTDQEEWPKAALSVDIVCLKLTAGPGSQPEVLLVKRRNKPYKNMWALPGGFVDIATGETTEHAAVRELGEETGVWGIHESEMKLFGVYSELNRDPRHRTISVGYYLTVSSALGIVAGDDAAEASFFPLSLPTIRKAMPLAFDHNKILNDAVQTRLYMNCNGVWQMKELP